MTFEFQEDDDRAIYCVDYIKEIFHELNIREDFVHVELWDLEVVNTMYGAYAQVYIPTEDEVKSEYRDDDPGDESWWKEDYLKSQKR